MKSQVCCFVVLCFLATALAGPLSTEVRERRSVDCPTCPTAPPAPTPTGLPPYPNNCPNRPAGLVGILRALLYFVLNLVFNIIDFLIICSNRSDGPNIITLLANIFLEIQVCLVAMITAAVSNNNAEISVQITVLLDLMAQVLSVCGGIVGTSTANSWCCTSPGGNIAAFISGLLSAVLGIGTLFTLSIQITLCAPILQCILTFIDILIICLRIYF